MKFTQRRNAFTLFHLIVLLALFALLLSLLFPFIQKAREQSAKRALSHNNLRQMGLAIHSHHDVHNRLPAANDKKNFSGLAYLLPYLKQENLYKQIDFKKPSDDRVNAAARAIVVKVFLSPMDTRNSVLEGSAPTNYFLNAGTLADMELNNGMFLGFHGIAFGDVTDGMSNTVAVVESLMGDGGTKGANVARRHVRLKRAALKSLDQDAGVDDFAKNVNVVGTRGSSWMDGRFLMSSINAGRMPNDKRPDVSCAGFGGWGGPRTLSRTFNVLMADGSARSVSVNVSRATWLRAMNRMDGHELGNDF